MTSYRFSERMILSDTYQRFVYDTGLYLYGGLWIGILAWYLRKGLWQNHHWMYFGFSFAGLILAIFIHYKRDRKLRMFLNINRGQMLLIIINIGLLVWMFMNFKGIVGGPLSSEDWFIFTEELMISSWEQMCFGVVCPWVLLSLFKFNKQSGLTEKALMFGAVLVSSVGFALAHWTIYSGSILQMTYLFLTGVILMSVCYGFSPSTSITLHLLNNLLVMKSIGV